jgi:hypothetical protein
MIFFFERNEKRGKEKKRKEIGTANARKAAGELAQKGRARGVQGHFFPMARPSFFANVFLTFGRGDHRIDGAFYFVFQGGMRICCRRFL